MLTLVSIFNIFIPLYVLYNQPEETRHVLPCGTKVASHKCPKCSSHYEFIIQCASHTNKSQSHMLKEEKPPQKHSVPLPITSTTPAFLPVLSSPPTGIQKPSWSRTLKHTIVLWPFQSQIIIFLWSPQVHPVSILGKKKKKKSIVTSIEFIMLLVLVCMK